MGCENVMVENLREWLKKQGINGPLPSKEAEARAMWSWIREFHKEYSDDWFTRNMPRLLEKFRPIFNTEMLPCVRPSPQLRCPLPPVLARMTCSSSTWLLPQLRHR